MTIASELLSVLESIEDVNEAKNERSVFLSTLFKEISGDSGKALVTAFSKNDIDKTKELLTIVVNNIIKKMEDIAKRGK